MYTYPHMDHTTTKLNARSIVSLRDLALLYNSPEPYDSFIRDAAWPEWSPPLSLWGDTCNQCAFLALWAWGPADWLGVFQKIPYYLLWASWSPLSPGPNLSYTIELVEFLNVTSFKCLLYILLLVMIADWLWVFKCFLFFFWTLIRYMTCSSIT